MCGVVTRSEMARVVTGSEGVWSVSTGTALMSAVRVGSFVELLGRGNRYRGGPAKSVASGEGTGDEGGVRSVMILCLSADGIALTSSSLVVDKFNG